MLPFKRKLCTYLLCMASLSILQRLAAKLSSAVQSCASGPHAGYEFRGTAVSTSLFVGLAMDAVHAKQRDVLVAHLSNQLEAAESDVVAACHALGENLGAYLGPEARSSFLQPLLEEISMFHSLVSLPDDLGQVDLASFSQHLQVALAAFDSGRHVLLQLLEKFKAIGSGGPYARGMCH